MSIGDACLGIPRKPEEALPLLDPTMLKRVLGHVGKEKRDGVGQELAFLYAGESFLICSTIYNEGISET